MTDDAKRSPKVLSLAWGRMEVEGLGSGKDFKLYPGGGREWDWSETGMSHEPGIQYVDVAELVERGATTIVLSRGMEQRLKVEPGTLDALKNRATTVHVAGTEDAVHIYNSLVGHEPVGGLFHSTC